MTAKWYTDDELRALLQGPEGGGVEWKESEKGAALRNTICAFANDLHDRHKPGVVFVGVDDTGKTVGLSVDEVLLNALADIRSHADMVPPPSLRVTSLLVDDGQVACVQVWPASAPPIKFKGRIYVRDGASTRIAGPEDERVLSEKCLVRNPPFDVRPFPAADMKKDLDLVYYERQYLPAALPEEILAENDRTLEQRLSADKMIVGADDPVPTILGLLILSTRVLDFLPGAHVQFLRIDGDELDENIVDAEEISGTIADIVRNTESTMRTHNRVEVKYVTVPREQRKWLYPPTALEQIFRNAIMHRSYESITRPVDVRWYNNRVEIISPGGPYGIAPDSENFPPKGMREYRNPGLAAAMKVLDLVQRYGTGVDQAKRALAKNGNPPLEYEVNQSTVICTLKPAL